MTELVPQISAFAVAAMRLMPSVNRINTHMSNIAFYEPSVNYVYENVDFTSYRLHGKYEKDYDPHTPPMELKKEIRMEAVSYTHLDVYKRQGYGKAQTCGILPARSGLTNIILNPWAS